MCVNDFFTFFSEIFRSDITRTFQTRFLYYTYIYFYGNIFCKKIAYMCVYARVNLIDLIYKDYINEKEMPYCAPQFVYFFGKFVTLLANILTYHLKPAINQTFDSQLSFLYLCCS